MVCFPAILSGGPLSFKEQVKVAYDIYGIKGKGDGYGGSHSYGGKGKCDGYGGSYSYGGKGKCDGYGGSYSYDSKGR